MYQKTKQVLAGKKRVNRRAFTLIELLVVVLIIGILAAVALPQYNKAVDKSKAAQMISNIRTIAQAQKIYFMENGKYAPFFDDLVLTIPELTGNYTVTSNGDIYSLRGFTERNYNYVLGLHNYNLGQPKLYSIAYDLNTDTLYCRAGSPAWPAGKFCASLAGTTPNNNITCPWQSKNAGSERCWAI